MTKCNLSSKRLIISSIFGLLCFSGCALHIHNPYLAQTAQEAKKEMDAYSENAPKMYSAMLTNIEKFREEEDRLLTDMAENYHTALVTSIPSKKFSYLKDRVTDDIRKLNEFKEKIIDEAKEYLANKEIFEGEKKSAELAIRQFSKEIEDEKNKVSMINAYIAFLQTAFKDYPKLENDFLKIDNLDKLAKTASEVGNKEIEYIDADGNEAKIKIADLIIESQPFFKTSYNKDDKQQKSVEDNVPNIEGRALSVLNLGLDLAEISQKKATMRVTRLEERKKIIENSLSEVSIAATFLNELNAGSTDEGGGIKDWPNDEIAYDYIVSLKKGPEAGRQEINKVSNVLLQIRKLAIAENILSRRQALLTVALEREDHKDSIIDSNIADEMWRTITSSGIDSLVAFHEGGIKDEDVANLLYLAQSIGLSAIAVGVN